MPTPQPTGPDGTERPRAASGACGRFWLVSVAGEGALFGAATTLAGVRPRLYRHAMILRVECYAGYRGEQEPVAFWFGARRLVVRAITDRWFAPTQRRCKVDADDDQTYVLRYEETNGQWDLAALTRRIG